MGLMCYYEKELNWKILPNLPNLTNKTIPRNWEDPNLVLLAQNLMNSDEWKSEPDSSNPFWVQEKEFRVYSQFGDDGIIQWLIYKLGLSRGGSFIEFGVGDYFESNTHFLLINNRYNGFVMDGSKSNIDSVRSSPIYWRYQLNAVQHFIDRNNIQSKLRDSGFEKAELLHLDLDGNDYWILERLDLSKLNPDILILEYNAAFGKDRSVTVPYDPSFDRIEAHYSGKYFGASLPALDGLAESKGYYFVGCNSAGNNAYFIANRHLSIIPEIDVSAGFQKAGFRESRDEDRRLTYISVSQEISLLRGLPIIDTASGKKIQL